MIATQNKIEESKIIAKIIAAKINNENKNLKSRNSSGTIKTMMSIKKNQSIR